MTVRELLTYIESVKPHIFPDSALLLWLNELEGRVQLDIFLMAPEETVEYTLPDDNETVLLVDLPHTGIYRYWLEAMIDFESGEYNQYQNSVELFNNAWNEFACWFAETQGTEGDGVSRGFYLSAYGIAVKHGYTGSEEEWLHDLKGEKGDPFTYDDFTEEQLNALREGVVQDTLDQARDHAQAAEESARAAGAAVSSIGTSVEDAAASAAAARSSATAAASARGQAYSYMDSARNSATKAAESAALAEEAKGEAERFMEYAAESESVAGNLVKQAEGYRDEAKSAAGQAESAEKSALECADAAEAAQAAAEKARDEAQQIAGGNIFFAEYGVTTHAEVLEAFTAGSLVCMQQDNRIYTLSNCTSTLANFTCVNSRTVNTYQLRQDTGWFSRTQTPLVIAEEGDVGQVLAWDADMEEWVPTYISGLIKQPVITQNGTILTIE